MKEEGIRILYSMALRNGSLRSVVCGFILCDTLAHIYKTNCFEFVACNSKVSCFGFLFYISGFSVCDFADGNSFITCCSGLFDYPFWWTVFQFVTFSLFLRFLCHERLLRMLHIITGNCIKEESQSQGQIKKNKLFYFFLLYFSS